MQATFTTANSLTMKNVSATAQFYGKGKLQLLSLLVKGLNTMRRALVLVEYGTEGCMLCAREHSLEHA